MHLPDPPPVQSSAPLLLAMGHSCFIIGKATTWIARWALARGCTSRVRPALFAGGLRGAAAAEDICAGDLVLSVPRELLLSAATAERSDLVRRTRSAADSAGRKGA